MALTPGQGLFLFGATLLAGTAVVRKMRKPKKKACTIKIYSAAPEPLRDDIVQKLKPAAQAVTEGKPYYLTPDAQGQAFALLAGVYTNEWWPRSLAIRKVLTTMAPECDWYGDQHADFTPAMFFIWQSMWTLAATVEADMGIDKHVKPAANNILAREQLGLGLGKNGEKPIDSYAVFVASDPDGQYTEEVAVIARDWRIENGVIIQKYQVMGHQVDDKWVSPKLAKHHGYGMTDDIELANAYVLVA